MCFSAAVIGGGDFRHMNIQKEQNEKSRKWELARGSLLLSRSFEAGLIGVIPSSI